MSTTTTRTVGTITQISSQTFTWDGKTGPAYVAKGLSDSLLAATAFSMMENAR